MKLASLPSIDVGFAELPIYRQNVCIGSIDTDLFLIRGCSETRSSDSERRIAWLRHLGVETGQLKPHKSLFRPISTLEVKSRPSERGYVGISSGLAEGNRDWD